MQYQIYVNQAKQLALQIYHFQLFRELVIVLTACLFFVIGRMSYERKLTHLLDMVNDAETTRKNLTKKIQAEKQSIKIVQSKKKILRILTAVVVVTNLGYYYFVRSININYILYSVAPVAVIWVLYILSLRYLKWHRNSSEQQLKSTSISAQTEVQEILNIFGGQLKSKLKQLYEQDIDAQWIKESRQSCKLAKCYDEKQSYQKLFKLYQQIIDKIKQINMCDICLNEENISVQKLGLQDLQANIKNFNRVKSSNLSLQMKKQLVNRLLQEYQKISKKLQFICKKGCCIKQRVCIEETKAEYDQRIKNLNAQLLRAIDKK